MKVLPEARHALVQLPSVLLRGRVPRERVTARRNGDRASTVSDSIRVTALHRTFLTRCEHSLGVHQLRGRVFLTGATSSGRSSALGTRFVRFSRIHGDGTRCGPLT